MRGRSGQRLRWPVALLMIWALAVGVGAQAQSIVDLATLDPEVDNLLRVYGSVGRGNFGVPVTGGFDCDGDGLLDMAMASMTASPLDRERAGEVYLIFGDGTIGGTRDTAGMSADILKIVGAAPHEITGNEIWMDDVTGDGLGDLLIGRQNYTPSPDRAGAGALTLIVGGSALREYAATLQPLDLLSPPATLTIITFVGAQSHGHLGMWMRTGDVTGDVTADMEGNVIPAPIADIVVAADQVSVNPGEAHNGRAYIIRGGPHLNLSQTIDFADFGTTPLAGHVIRIEPPEQADHYHVGATCQIADLNGNGVGEVLLASALSRNSASLRADGISDANTAHSLGGKPKGTLYIAWDDNFMAADTWQPGASFRITSLPGSHSIIHGGDLNHHFGEEILGGRDYNNDGLIDLFVGDIDGDLSASHRRWQSGAGHVLYNAPMLMGLEFSLDAPPAGLMISTWIGAQIGDIAADTAVHGDFDGDGIADLALSAPHGNPLQRDDAGIFYVLHGQNGFWPPFTDLLEPMPDGVRMTYLYGAQGHRRNDSGDVLGYSADTGDFDGDGKTDLIANEMLGNGLGSAIDTGNLIVISGQYFTGAPTSPTPE